MIYTNTVSVPPDEIARLAAATGGDPNITAALLTCTDATACRRLRREISLAFDRHLVSGAETDAPTAIRRRHSVFNEGYRLVSA